MKGWWKMRNDKQTPVNIETIIGPHANFNGELHFEGAVRIDGKFEGNIQSSNDGTLIVSEVAHITGEVDVPNLVLHGTVCGNVRASESLQVSATGKLEGDLEYRVLSLTEGASINGKCKRIEKKVIAKIGPENEEKQTLDSKLGQSA